MSIVRTPHRWILQTDTTAYALGINPSGRVVTAYRGPRLPHADDYPPPPDSGEWASFNGPAHLMPEEYPAYAGRSYAEPCLKVTFADAVRDAVLVYRDGVIDDTADTLTITLSDAHYPLTVTLHYRVHPHYDLIERWATLTNTGDAPITLERVFSAQWHMPDRIAYRLSHLTGRWNDEFILHRQPLPTGVTQLESRRLTSSHQHQPWFALDDGTATETTGGVYFGVLAWSGNWKLTAEVTHMGMTRLGIGLNDWDFDWTLEAGASFVTPASLGGYSAEGFGGASRRLHDYIRDRVVPHGPAVDHKVLYNSWEATLFDVDVASQKRLADLAAAMGIELFVMDDGWFHGRTSDRAGLGDWWPDETKFPDGLSPLIDHVRGLGMDFGLWIEPEMVNPDSDLYRAHPDWTIHFPTRTPTTARNQLILNMAREDVRDYLFARFDALLTQHAIAFIKWDMNRNISEPGWPAAGDRQRELWVRYVQGVYDLWGRLRARHPHVIWQSCSGGGGRVDLGILHHADQVWPSDNTEAPARLRIQEGFSQVYPASIMEAWVTDSGERHIPLSFRFHVSMAGVLGVGGHLLHWTADERAQAAALIAQYKGIRRIVQQGDQYRLLSAYGGAVSAVQYMAKDSETGVLLAWRTHLPNPAILPRVHPCGLRPGGRYTIEGIERDGVPVVRTGAAWMQIGIDLVLRDFDSTLRRIQRVG